MPDAFDPYHKWLGIPPSEQPADHYRLLGIARFESDPDVIETAADQRMGHLRMFQTGQHSALSQKLLNELAAVRLCLLNPEKKAAYDAELRRGMAVAPSAEPALPSARPLPAAPMKPLPSRSRQTEVPALIVTDDKGPRRSTRRRRSSIGRAGYAWFALAAVALPASAFVAYLFWNRGEPQKQGPSRPVPNQLASSAATKAEPKASAPQQREPAAASTTDKAALASPATPQNERQSAINPPETVSREISPKTNDDAEMATAEDIDGLTIVDARWGAGNKWADVTAPVRSGVRDGRYLATVIADALGGKDPASGTRKQLVVRYRVAGDPQTRTETFDDYQLVYLGVDDPAVSQEPGLTLLEAKYGAGKIWVDVLDRLKPLVKDNSLAVRADRAASVDPLPGATKALFVRYALNGRTAHASAVEGKELRINVRPAMADALAASPQANTSPTGGTQSQPARPAEPVSKSPSLGELAKEKEPARLTAKEVASLKQHTAAVTRVAFHRTSPVLASAGKDGQVLLWNLQTGGLPLQMHKYAEEVWAIKFHPDGTSVAFANWNWWGSRLMFKNLLGAKLNEVKDFKNGGGAVTSIAYSHDGRLLAAGQDNGTVRLWDILQFREIDPVGLGDGHNVRSLAFGPAAFDRRNRATAYLLAEGGLDGMIRTLRVTTNNQGQPSVQQTTVEFPKAGEVRSLRFSQKGDLLGCTRIGGAVSLLNPQTGQTIRDLARGGGSVEWIAFHPRNPWCVTAHKDAQVARIWNTDTAELLCELKGHTGGVMCAEFSPDGRRLATASEDFSIKLWDLAGPGVVVETKKGKKPKPVVPMVGD